MENGVGDKEIKINRKYNSVTKISNMYRFFNIGQMSWKFDHEISQIYSNMVNFGRKFNFANHIFICIFIYIDMCIYKNKFVLLYIYSYINMYAEILIYTTYDTINQNSTKYEFAYYSSPVVGRKVRDVNFIEF
jgi:hypothetical protein